MSSVRALLLATSIFAIAACSPKEEPSQIEEAEVPLEEEEYVEQDEMEFMVPGEEREVVWDALTPEEARDKFTYSNYNDVRVTHLNLDLVVDFDTKTLSGTAEISFRRRARGTASLVLDANMLDVSKVEAFAEAHDGFSATMSSRRWCPSDQYEPALCSTIESNEAVSTLSAWASRRNEAFAARRRPFQCRMVRAASAEPHSFDGTVSRQPAARTVSSMPVHEVRLMLPLKTTLRFRSPRDGMQLVRSTSVRDTCRSL